VVESRVQGIVLKAHRAAVEISLLDCTGASTKNDAVEIAAITPRTRIEAGEIVVVDDGTL
jgi:hypothetical protein